jgi:hypothetical protein
LSGGSGAIVQMTLPISNGTVTPQGGTAKSYSGSAVIEVYLNFIPQPTSTAASSGTRNNLSIKLTTSDPVNQPVVSVQSVTLSPDSKFQGTDAIQSALSTWLNANIQSFNHVFAAVDLNVIADKDAFQWLKPTKVGYAVNAPAFTTPDNYIFGVLAMTEGRDNPNLSNQISPNIIPDNSNAGFAISQERFINKLFLPGAYLLFKGASSSDFDTTDDGSKVINIDPLNFQKFALEDGTLITDATIGTGNFTLTAFDQSLELQFTNLQFTWKSGYIVNLSYTGIATFSLDANHCFQMKPTGQSSLNIVVTKTTAEKWMELGIGILEGVAFAALGAAIGGALGPAVDAAEGAVDDGVTNAAEAADSSGSDDAEYFSCVSEDEIDNPDEVASESENDAAEDIANANDESYAAKFKGFFRRNWAAMLGAAIGSGLAVAASQLPDILEAYAENNLDKMPTLDEFADQAVSPTKWPNSGAYTLNSGDLNRSLQFGINVAFNAVSNSRQMPKEETALAGRTA